MKIDNEYKLALYPGISIGVRSDYQDVTMADNNGDNAFTVRETYHTFMIPFVEFVILTAECIEGQESFNKAMEEADGQ